MQGKAERAKQAIQALQNEGNEFDQRMSRLYSVVAIASLTEEVQKWAKDFKKGHVRVWRTEATTVARTMGAQSRRAAAGTAAGAAQMEEDSEPVRITCLKEVSLELGASYKVGSLFEAKAGHAPTLLPCLTTIRGKEFDLITTISKTLPAKQALKALDTHLKSSTLGVAPIEDDAKGKRVIAAMHKTFEPMVFQPFRAMLKMISARRCIVRSSWVCGNISGR